MYPHGLVLLAACLGASTADPAVRPLTLEQAVAVAAQQSTSVRVAATRLDEAAARLEGASALPNPTVEVSAGPRFGAVRTAEVDVGAAMPLDVFGRRSRSVGVAQAASRREGFASADARRLAAGAAAEAWLRLLHAQERARLAGEREALARELRATAEARRTAGEVARFDVNLAEADEARAESESLAAKRELAHARLRLASALGFPSEPGALVAEGRLDDRAWLEARIARGASERPDLLEARAAVDEAQAGVALAGTERLPEVDLRLGYAREEFANVATAGFALTLPVFQRGQAARGEAAAQRQRADLELKARTAAQAAEAQAAGEAYAAAASAADRLAQRAVPKALENEEMAREAYRAGKLDLPAVLAIRRDALETRVAHLDQSLDAALAAADLAVALGALP